MVVGPPLNLESPASIRDFAANYAANGWPLHVLVNNAGMNYVGEPWYTPSGIGGVCQVNYLGPYLLTRLLEDQLIHSAPARVVNLSSVTHRFGSIGDPGTFLTSWAQGSRYQNSKLANALFAFELHRRLAPFGVTSCAVDPGSVASSIWRDSLFSQPPIKTLIKWLYAPSEDGATAVVHAATVPWEQDAAAAEAVNSRWARSSQQALPSRDAPAGQHSEACDPSDLRFYARGAFAWPTVTSLRGAPGASTSPLERLREAVYAVSTLVHSGIDWPLRRLSGGRVAATTAPVPANPLCYDERLSKGLWEVSADAVGVPRKVAVRRRSDTPVTTIKAKK